MKTLRPQYPLTVMCRVFDVSRSGYHAFVSRAPSKRAQEDARLIVAIQVAHTRTRESYGPLRLQDELKDDGVKAGVGRIKRLRKQLGLRCKQVRKFKATTNSNHNLPVAPNLLEQHFDSTRPNETWVTDITYVATDEGWLYLSGVKDLHTCELVGHAKNRGEVDHRACGPGTAHGRGGPAKVPMENEAGTSPRPSRRRRRRGESRPPKYRMCLSISST